VHSYAQAEALASAAPPTGIQLGITVHTGHRKLLLTVAESPDQLLPDFVCDMFLCHHILREFTSVFMMANQKVSGHTIQWRLRAYQKRTCWTFGYLLLRWQKMLPKLSALEVLSAEAQVIAGS
jgi:hypothetical protein